MTISAFRNVGLAVLALGVTAATTTVPASARDGAVAAGVLGGLAAGAIVGSAVSAQPAYGYPAYAPPPPPPPVYDTGCYFTRQATYDPYGNFAGYRRVRVCD